MKTKEKLSDKEYLLFNDEDWIRLGDVKEFIKKLKEEFVIGMFTSSFIKKKIDELMGEDLK